MPGHSKPRLGNFRPSWLTLIACLLLISSLSFFLIPSPVFSAAPPSLSKANATDPHRHNMLTRVQWVFAAFQQTPDTGHSIPINTTLQDFHLPGTQPNGLTTPLAESNQCKGCHVGHIVDNYAGSMMANAARDPLFRAALQVANKDAKVGGELCIRCHSPNAWLNGRATPSDGSAINAEDLQGVSCSTCHRLVPPTATAGEATGDAAERTALTGPFITGSAAYIVDRNDVRRGPFTVAAPHGAALSGYLRSSEMCATCHDIDNPILTFDNVAGEFKLNTLNTPASAGARLFPVERTYSEWKNSSFATVSGVTGLSTLFPGLKRKDGTESGPITVCQDCHMPMVASALANGSPVRTVGKHQWAGGNSVWQDAITNVWGTVAADTHFDQTQTTANKALGDDLLKRAAQVDISLVNGQAEVKVTNNTGHKLPTGYAEGRRMWLKVTQFNGATPIFTSGAWKGNQGPLINDPNLKIYEIKQGISDAHAQTVGLPAGESFHFILNNKIFKDNRIPPRGFTNAAFAARDAGPVAYSYPDAQYWDTTTYPLAPGATQISVTLYYQTASDEYLDFLKNNAGGQVNDAVLGSTDWAQVVENARTQLGVGRPVPIFGKTLFFTRYVATTGDDASDCTDFTQPCKTINYAIGKADANNVIRVAAGIYTEAVEVNKAITLTGGFTLTNWSTPNWTTNQTIIDGQNNHRPVLIQAEAYFDGFMVRNGNAENATVSARFGGGILINALNTFDKASIVNTKLENNVAALTSNGNGGGLAANIGNTFQIPDQLVLSNVIVVNNMAVKGDNGAGGLGAAGGGLFIAAQGTSHLNVDMTNVTVLNNTAGNDFSSVGGGIVMSLQGGIATLRQVKVVGNHAAKISTFLGGPSKGGGIDFNEGILVAENVLIVRNDAGEGGALRLSGNTYSNTVKLNFVTIADNNLAPGVAQEAVRIEGAQNNLTLVNTLVSGNAVAFAGKNTTQAPSLKLTNALLDNNVTTIVSGTVTTADTPLRGGAGYINAGAGDYHLTASSAAVDKGSNLPPLFDLDGVMRPLGAKPDIGAYEFAPLNLQNQTITFALLPNKLVTDAAFMVNVTASSNLPVTFNSSTPVVCTVSGNTVTLLATGTCTILAAQGGNGAFNPAPSVPQSFAVTSPGKQSQTITFSALADKVLGDAPFNLSATASSNLPVIFSSSTPSICTVNGSTVTLVTTGICTIVATQDGNGVFNPATPVSQNFTIANIGSSAQKIFLPLVKR